jgi:heat shock protein HslJ
MIRKLALMSFLAVIGCVANHGGGGAAEFTIQSIAGKSWQLVRMESESGETRPVDGSLVSFSCTPEGAVAGQASINRYSGSMVADGSRISRWNPFRVTRMAGPPELMTQETLFLQALPKTTRFFMLGEKLVFVNKDRGVRLEFIALSD